MKEKNETIYDAGYEHGNHEASANMRLVEPRNQTVFAVGVIAGLSASRASPMYSTTKSAWDACGCSSWDRRWQLFWAV